MTWTDRMYETLHRLWLEGETCSGIGVRVGVSASAVAGMARRRGLPKRKSPIKGESPEVQQRRHAAQRAAYERRRLAKGLPILPPKPKPPPPPRTFQPVVIPLPPPPTCHWPVGEGKDIRFCGDVPERGKPYCADHCKVAYVKVSRRDDAA